MHHAAPVGNGRSAPSVTTECPRGADRRTENVTRMLDAVAAKPPTPPVMDGLPPERRRWAVAAIFTALAMAALDHRDRQRRAARHRRRSACQSCRCGLGGQCLPDRPLVANAVAARRARRNRRPPAHLSRRSVVVHAWPRSADACAWSLESLLMARARCGVGASGLMSVNTALVRFRVSEPDAGPRLRP